MQGSPVIFSLEFGSMIKPWPRPRIYASRILTPHEEISDSVIVVEDGQITRWAIATKFAFPEDSEHFAAGDRPWFRASWTCTFTAPAGTT